MTSYEELRHCIELMMEDNEDSEVWVKEEIGFLTLRFIDQMEKLEIDCPQLLSHGPNSLILNWEGDNYNFYATISRNEISLLLTDKDGVVHRMDIPYK